MNKFITIGLALSLFCIMGKAQVITIETANTALVYAVDTNKRLVFQHYGNKLSDPGVFLNKKYQKRDQLRFVISDPYNSNAYTSFGNIQVDEPALCAIHSDGSLMTDLVFDRTGTETNQKGVNHTIIHLKDIRLNFDVELHFESYVNEDVINQWVVISNMEEGKVTLKNFYSGHLYLNAEKYFLTHFGGSWGAEMGKQEEQLTNGLKIIESKKGVRTTLTENSAFLISLNHPALEDEGEVIGGALAWSGNFRMVYQLDEWDRLNILGGINPFLSEVTLKKGQQFETPKMVFTYSNKGQGQVSRNLHDWARRYSLANGFSARPIVLNSWEGAFFSFNEKVLTDMMDDASKMGIEMFVLDDGWFGNKYPRDNDSAGLGDWQTNMEKLPHGISFLADHAEKRGMKFGIWIEPEMVNPKSELAEAHPEWVVQSPGREKLMFRNQWVLDLSNPQVQDFIWKMIDNMLISNPKIAYLKWDSNRHIDQVGSTFLSGDKQNEFWIAYIQGLYKVYTRVREKYPNLILQACSSGGGRVDFGALRFHHEFWASDNTDPLERLRIQYGTNLIYPPIATTSHVSKSGTVTPIKFRFDVAMTGRLGVELMPKDLTVEDRKIAQNAVETYKRIRPIIAGGDLYRLQSPYDQGNRTSLMYVSKDKRKAVVFAFSTGYHKQGIFPTLKLKGINPLQKYKVTELNKAPHSSWGNKENINFWGNDEVLDGQFLMKSGMELIITRPYDSAVFLIEAE